ncbi:MAG TPA: hypothetical protein VK886_04925 [Vicinamibacterales bacterium]|nr:hypothetical protein [Vicinamibacterales bacterium]
MADLGTTNTWLAIMAIVAMLEALVVIGIGVGAFVAYRRVLALVDGLEQRHVAPLSARAQGILDDVKGITAKAQVQAERVDNAIAGTMDRVDVTAERVKRKVSERVAHVTGVIRGVRAALASVMTTGNGRRPSAA